MAHEVHVRLSWKGWGRRIHGNVIVEWQRVDGGMAYGVWSVRRQMWLLQHFVPD